METDTRRGLAPRVAEPKDWRSDSERAGWCRCGTREDEPQPRCGWHMTPTEARELLVSTQRSTYEVDSALFAKLRRIAGDL